MVTGEDKKELLRLAADILRHLKWRNRTSDPWHLISHAKRAAMVTGVDISLALGSGKQPEWGAAINLLESEVEHIDQGET